MLSVYVIFEYTSFNENPTIEATTLLRIMNSVDVYTLLPKSDSSNAILTQMFQMRATERTSCSCPKL